MNDGSVSTCILEASILPSVSEVRRCGKCGRSLADLLAGKTCGESGESPAAEVAADDVRARRLDNGRALLLARDEVIADELAVRKAEADRAEVVRAALIADLYQRERAWEVACRAIDDACGVQGDGIRPSTDYPGRDGLPSLTSVEHVNFIRVWLPGYGSFEWMTAVSHERALAFARSTGSRRPMDWHTIDRSTPEAYQRTRAAWDADRDRELREWCVKVIDTSLLRGIKVPGVRAPSDVDAAGNLR